MKYTTYCTMVIERFPESNYKTIIENRKVHGWNCIDLVNSVAKDLLIEKDVLSPVAEETIKQLKYIRENGQHCFK